MPKILITGNGFDLKHGLPTFYKDFITILGQLKSIKNHNFDSVYSLSVNYKVLKEKYNEFDFDKKNIDKLIKLLETNIWFNFFETELEIESWIDFETKIEYVLKLIFSSVNFLKEKIFSKNPLQIGHVVSDSSLFNNNIEILEVLNFFKIIEWNSSYSRLVLKEIYFHQKYNYNVDVNTEKIANHLNNEILDFRKIFNLYFETFVVPLYPNIKKEDKINNIFGGIKYHFTFNYTPTFELLYKSFIKTNYLHGKIGENSNLVLGINDIPDDVVNKIHYIPFTKYFQKLNGNTDFYFLNKITEGKLSNYTFYFYGHSLDKSDEDYINEVFNFIDSINVNRIKKIIVIIHNIESKAQLLINLINIRGKDDIVKKMRENILQFILADSEELFKELTSRIDSSISNPTVF